MSKRMLDALGDEVAVGDKIVLITKKKKHAGLLLTVSSLDKDVTAEPSDNKLPPHDHFVFFRLRPKDFVLAKRYSDVVGFSGVVKIGNGELKD